MNDEVCALKLPFPVYGKGRGINIIKLREGKRTQKEEQEEEKEKSGRERDRLKKSVKKAKKYCKRRKIMLFYIRS